MLFYCNMLRWARWDWELCGWLTTLLQCCDQITSEIKLTDDRENGQNLHCGNVLDGKTTTLWGIKNCTLLTGTITLQNYAILWWFLAYRCTSEYPIGLFDSLCKIKNWEPAYQICYCLLSSRQRKIWNSCYNARPQTSLLQTYGLLTFLTSILSITDIWSTAVTFLSEIC